MTRTPEGGEDILPTEPAGETPEVSEVTNTPAPVCTPPPCTADEVYYCPGDCPGGCGTECATPTSQPSSGETTLEPPTIQSFTADRTTIVEGEEVTLSWQATGAAETFIQWVGSDGLLKGPTGIEDPNGGTVTITPTGDGTISLLVRNAAGQATAEIQLTIQCPHDWAPALAADPPISTGCPGEHITTWAAWQPFQNGFMIWMEAEDGIFVFYNTGQYQFYEDRFNEGDPESDPSLVPPDGLYQPIRGFGLVWRENPVVRDGLGWATAQESGYESWMQSFSGTGMHSYSTIMKGVDGTLYLLGAFASQWQVYTP